MQSDIEWISEKDNRHIDFIKFSDWVTRLVEDGHKLEFAREFVYKKMKQELKHAK